MASSSEMAVDTPPEQISLEQLLAEVNAMKDPAQFAQGASAKPAIMLDLIHKLSERHVAYLTQKEQLNDTNNCIQELEQKSKKKVSRDSEALTKLVEILGSRSNCSASRIRSVERHESAFDCISKIGN
ncbi:hypothetical protein K3495_g16730 [Podosphaera aphanis]|nr:hypothetical protein K3495_g16730 [Podosphaera aphanis]